MTTLKINRQNNTIIVQRTARAIMLKRTGPRGLPGQGLPTGGTPGEVLIKNSSVDYDVAWSTSGASDKNYTQPFTSQSSVTVAHNLGKYPAVSIVDSAGDEVRGDVVYNSANQVTLNFSAPFSGTVYCN